MMEAIKEYGGMALAVAGGFSLFGILGYEFLAEDGLIARLIFLWGNGGC